MDYAKQLNNTDGPDLYRADRIIRGFRREQLSRHHLETRAEDTVTNCPDRCYSFVGDRTAEEDGVNVLVASRIN